jgi:hypothetical protein
MQLEFIHASPKRWGSSRPSPVLPPVNDPDKPFADTLTEDLMRGPKPVLKQMMDQYQQTGRNGDGRGNSDQSLRWTTRCGHFRATKAGIHIKRPITCSKTPN